MILFSFATIILAPLLKSVSLKPDLSTYILDYVVCSCTILTLDIIHKPFHIMNVFTAH